MLIFFAQFHQKQLLLIVKRENVESLLKCIFNGHDDRTKAIAKENGLQKSNFQFSAETKSYN